MGIIFNSVNLFSPQIIAHSHVVFQFCTQMNAANYPQRAMAKSEILRRIIMYRFSTILSCLSVYNSKPFRLWNCRPVSTRVKHVLWLDPVICNLVARKRGVAVFRNDP